MELLLKIVKITTYLFGGAVVYYDVTHDRPVWAIAISFVVGMNIGQDLSRR